MYFYLKKMYYVHPCVLLLISVALVQNVEKKSFRIIAPQIICPKNEEVVSNAPDTTSVMIQARGGHLELAWTVRWVHLKQPSQRFTLLLWRSVRNLEKTLNRKQPEQFLYVIDNNELLPDVDYIFNVTGIMDGEILGHKMFRINNVSGKKTLELSDGETDKFSLMLLGGDLIYNDMEYMLEAVVTMCRPTHNYHFIWTLDDLETGAEIISNDMGSRLTIPSGTLTVNHNYDITCEVVRSTDNAFINEMHYSVQILQRGLEAALNSDLLVVSTSTYFSIQVEVYNHDGLPEEFHFEWTCIFNGDPCESFNSEDSNILEILNGLPDIGTHEIEVAVTSGDSSTKAIMSIEAVEPRLPVLEVSPIRRLVNEGGVVSLIGNATNIAPSCSLTWYFATNDYQPENDSCEACVHGEPVTDTITVLSIEENFLTELADFNNATEWRQLTAEIDAAAGRARLVAKCGCSLTFNCDTAGTVYADVHFELNSSPLIGEITVTPLFGTALETIFTIRTKPAEDKNTPLRYDFYTRVGEDVTLLLNSYVEYFAVETYLPYIDGVTTVWVEVCDSLNACSQSEVSRVHVDMANGVTPQYITEKAEAHLRRCEMLELQKLSVSAFVSFQKEGKTDELSELTAALSDLLARGPSETCLQNHSKKYSALLDTLAATGFDVTNF